MEPKIAFELEVERQRAVSEWTVSWNQYASPLEATVRRDRSLRTGREYVAHTPRTLAEWRERDLTSALEQLATVASGDRTVTAGLHLHLDRAAFSAAGLARLFTIVNHPDQVVRRLSRRTRFRYCAFDERRPEDGWTKLAEDGFNPPALRKEWHNKYTAVHCHPTYPTVELRFFRSTVQPDRFYAALETAHALWAYAEQLNRPATGKDWAAWVKRHPNYALLAGELKARKAVPVGA